MNTKLLTTRLIPALAMFLAFTGARSFGQSMISEPVQNFSGLGGTSTADTFNFSTFNTSLGTLTSVEIELENVTLSGTAIGTNNSNVNLPNGDTNGPEDIYVNLGGTLTVTSPGGINEALHAVDTLDNGQTEVAVGASTPTYTYTNTPATPSSNNQSTTSSLASYTSGSGSSVTITVTPSHFGVTGQAYASADSTANYVSGTYNGGATAAGSVEVIYTYTPVPEPAQTAAWMLGFVGMVLVGRKYLSRSATPACLSA